MKTENQNSKKSFEANEVMRERALSTLLIVWKNKKPDGSHVYSTYPSVDKITHRRKGQWESGADRLEEKVLKRHIGKFRSAKLYLNQPKGMSEIVLRKWNDKGQLVSVYDDLPEHKN